MINQQNKRKINLKVLNSSESTCYEINEKYNCHCQRQTCKQWINYPKGKNCTLITTQMGPLTLNEIGKIYGLTRMRICQIEKNIYQKIKEFILQ